MFGLFFLALPSSLLSRVFPLAQREKRDCLFPSLLFLRAWLLLAEPPPEKGGGRKMVLDQERTAANKQEGREKERAGEKLYKKNWKPKWSKPTKGGFVCKKSCSESKRFFFKKNNTHSVSYFPRMFIPHVLYST